MSLLNRNIHIPILAFILLAGLILRFYRLDNHSIFFDEKSTMVVSQGIVLEGANQKDVFSKPTFTPAEFWSHKTFDDYCEAMTRSDIGNSPFYYFLLHLWMDVFGLSDFSARSLSVFFSVLTILFTYLFASRFFSVGVALLAAAIVAIEPFFIAYSHQARNYSLTFFLTLLSTWFFLRLIENVNKNRKSAGLYLGYIIVSGLCLLSHFLTVSVFLAHGIYVIFFVKMHRWPRIALAGLLSLTGIVWWMTMGGGVWTLRTLAYQADLYRHMAETNPFNNRYGLILPATIPNVFFKSIPIFSDLIIFTNGLSEALEGKKNTLLSLATGIGLILLYHFRRNSGYKTDLIVPSVLLIGMGFVYTNRPLQFSILSVSVFALSFLPDLHRRAHRDTKRRLWFLYIISLVPTLFLIAFAFKNGHTYGLTQRYSGFSFPYVIILVSLLITNFGRIRPGFRYPVLFLLIIQLGFVMLRLNEFYQDRSVKYGYFAKPRRDNPYYEAAQVIRDYYKPGDTVFYPAPPVVMDSKMDSTFLSYSIQDAQLTNLYLPKNAEYTQAMNRRDLDRIILKRRAESDCLTVVNLRNVRY